MSHRLRRSTEHTLEVRLADVLKAVGHESIHNDPTLMKGIPDRYVMGAGGLWIEVKRERSWGKLVNGFDRQKEFLDMLYEQGDKAWVLALLEDDRPTPLLWFERWSHFRTRSAGVFRSTALERSVTGSPYEVPTYEALDEAIKHGFQEALEA